MSRCDKKQRPVPGSRFLWISEVTTMAKISQAAFSLLVLLTFIAITKDFTWSAEKSTKLATVRIGYVSRRILDMPYIIARDRGLFREEGLEPELIFIKAAQTVRAMLAGGIDFGTATGTGGAAAIRSE